MTSSSRATHEELLARGGFYAELYNSQFENLQMEEAEVPALQ